MSQQLKAGWILFALGLLTGWYFFACLAFFVAAAAIGIIFIAKNGDGNSLTLVILSIVAMTAVGS